MGGLLDTPLERLEKQLIDLEELIVVSEMHRDNAKSEADEKHQEMEQLLRAGSLEQARVSAMACCQRRKTCKMWNGHLANLMSLRDEIQSATHTYAFQEQINKLNYSMGSFSSTLFGEIEKKMQTLEKKLSLLKDINIQVETKLLGQQKQALTAEAEALLSAASRAIHLEHEIIGDAPRSEGGNIATDLLEDWLPAVPDHQISQSI